MYHPLSPSAICFVAEQRRGYNRRPRRAQSPCILKTALFGKTLSGPFTIPSDVLKALLQLRKSSPATATVNRY